MNSIIESLHIIRVVKGLIDNYTKSIINFKNPPNQFIFQGIKGQILLLTNSYLDEWDNYLIPNSDNTNFNTRIINLKKEASPAIKRIKKWNGIKDFRNSVLAHNFRDRKNGNKSVFLTDKYDHLYIPDHASELALLNECIKKSAEIVTVPFKQELENSKMDYFKDRGIQLKQIDVEKEWFSILNEINKLKKEK